MASASVMLIQPKGELWEKIREELNENINTRDQDIAAIKEWLRKQPHLPDDLEESCLLNFLRGCKFSLEKTKRKLDMYYTMRAACPEFFTNRDVTRPELMDIMIQGRGPTMPGLTPAGRRVTICRGIAKHLEPAHMIDVFKLSMMIGDVRLREEIEGVAGDVYVLDASVVTSSHLAKISPPMIKKFFICIQEAYPVKLKEVHVVNISPVIDVVFNIIKPFMKEKMKKRVFFHKDYSSLHQYIPKDMLPEEYGGTGPPLLEAQMAWIEKLKEYRNWFKEQESIKANEALRPGKPTNYDELFGIDGSFRQLSID